MKIAAYDLPRHYWQRVAKRAGIPGSTWRMRIARGMSPKAAATKPYVSRRSA